MELKKWQLEMVKMYEQITAFDIMGKDRIHDDESFWEVWDSNISWFENVWCDVQNISGSYEHYRPE